MRSIRINTLLATSAGPIIADGFACLPEDYNVLASVSVYRVSMCLTQSEFTADSLNGCVFAWKDSEAHGISDTCAAAMYEGIHTTVSGSCSTACDSLIVSNSCIACKAAAWAHTVGMLAPTGQGVCTGTSMQTFEDVSISAVTECGINHASSQAYCVLNHVTVTESCHTCLLHQVDLRVAECEDTCINRRLSTSIGVCTVRLCRLLAPSLCATPDRNQQPLPSLPQQLRSRQRPQPSPQKPRVHAPMSAGTSHI